MEIRSVAENMINTGDESLAGLTGGRLPAIIARSLAKKITIWLKEEEAL